MNGDRVDADPDRLRQLLTRLDAHHQRRGIPVVDAWIDNDLFPVPATPVHLKYAHDAPSQSLQPKVPSLADAVGVWVRMFDEDRYRYDPSTRRIESDRDGIDPQLTRTGLI